MLYAVEVFLIAYSHFIVKVLAFTQLDTGTGVPSLFTAIPGAIREGMSSAISTSPTKVWN